MLQRSMRHGGDVIVKQDGGHHGLARHRREETAGTQPVLGRQDMVDRGHGHAGRTREPFALDSLTGRGSRGKGTPMGQRTGAFTAAGTVTSARGSGGGVRRGRHGPLGLSHTRLSLIHT